MHKDWCNNIRSRRLETTMEELRGNRLWQREIGSYSQNGDSEAQHVALTIRSRTNPSQCVYLLEGKNENSKSCLMLIVY